MDEVGEGNGDSSKPPCGPKNHFPPSPQPSVVLSPLPPALDLQKDLLGILNNTSMIFLQVLNFISFILRSDCRHSFQDVRLRTQIEPILAQSACHRIYEIIVSERLHRSKWFEFKKAMIGVFNNRFLIAMDECKLIQSTFMATYGLLEQGKWETAVLLRFNAIIHGLLEKRESRNIRTWTSFVSFVPRYIMSGIRVWNQIAQETGIFFAKVSWKSVSSEVSDDNEDIITFFFNLCQRSPHAFNFDDDPDSEEEANNADMLRNIPPDQRTWDELKMKKVIDEALVSQGYAVDGSDDQSSVP